MPLPIGSDTTKWPPPGLAPVFTRMAQWSALYSNDLQKIQAAFGGGEIQDQTGFFASDKGGFRATLSRTLQRFFLGEPTRGPDRLSKVPVPVAAELCQGSADLLFADPVTVDSEHEATRDRLLELLDDREHTTYAEAAELAACLGGVYLRTTWDVKVRPDGPFTTLRDADQAVPEFLHGVLVAVNFWTVVARADTEVWRLIERHETRADDDGPDTGYIVYRLYKGTDEVLGTLQSLDALASTRGMLNNPDMGQDQSISTKSPGLAVTYVANQRPNRLWRSNEVGRYLGRSDLDGVEHLIDQLAEVTTAWVRAIRLGKARLFVGEHLLKNGGPGNGNVANLEQEAYTAVKTVAGPNASVADAVTMVEPAVHYEQYAATAEHLMEQILQMAGYSMQTFGVGDTGTVRTATEIESKERRSLLTRERKIREWRPALVAHLGKMLAVDNALFEGKSDPEQVDVNFTDGVQETQLALANTALALFQSQSASVERRVRIVNPDWDDDDVLDEVDKIEKEFAPDPLDEPGMGAMGGGSGGVRASASQSTGSESQSAA